MKPRILLRSVIVGMLALLPVACSDDEPEVQQTGRVPTTVTEHDRDERADVQAGAQQPPAGTRVSFSTDGDIDGDGMYDLNELTAAIEAEYADLQWPAAYPTTLDLLIGPAQNQRDQYPDKPVHWEIGSEYNFVGFPHLCAWGFAWLDSIASGDEPLMSRAESQLRTVSLEFPTFTSIRESIREDIDRAALGDVGEFRTLLESSCNMSVFATPSVYGPHKSTVVSRE